jgi:hypothetical protein
MIELSLDARVAAGEDVLSREVEGDTVLLSMAQAEYFGLNPTGTRIWQLLQEPRSIRDVCQSLIAEFDIESDVVEKDVLSVVTDLIAHRLVRIVADDQLQHP